VGGVGLNGKTAEAFILHQLCLVTVSLAVEVMRGRSAFITAKELKISVDPTEDCKVEVVMNEPATQRVGRLSPQVFDCSFLEDELKYVHNGSPQLDKDTVMLRVYRFTSTDTLVETVVLPVRVVDSDSDLVELGSTPLVVPHFHGLSNAIDSQVLNIRTTADRVCIIRLMTSDTSVPALGQLVREEDGAQRKGTRQLDRSCRETAALCPGNKPCLHDTKEVRFLKTSCQDFLNSGLKYQHLSPPSPEIDYIPIRVELREQATRALLESVWLPVLIQGAMQNQPPKAAFMASFILEVDQFILTPLTTAALDAKDNETPQERLVFNVTAPPAEGYITHLDDHTKPITSFTWLDLHEMKVAYQPPNSSQPHRRNYEVEFQAIDGSFLTSPPMMVHISIRAAETSAPRVSWNMGLDLLEGQSRPITWEQLQIVDSNDIDSVYLVAVDGPVHGSLSVRGGKAFMFRVRDLREGAVIYHHSDSDTTRDHIVFRISDGRHSIRHKFPINILPKDDSPPFLINNVAVEVLEGGAVRLEEYILLASDLDSSDDYILFQIVSSPRAGQLIRRSSAHKTGEAPVDSFLQRDLIQGQIYYQHLGEELFEDAFDVTLSDSHQPPNLSQRYTVVVHVFPVKDQLPAEVSGTVRTLTVKETEVVYITQAQLHFTDREQPDADLTYSITQPCFSPLHPRLMDAGRLFYTDSIPLLPVLPLFLSQHAVNHMKVAFMPPVEDIGPEPLLVQFVFSVSDQHGGTVSDLVFNITVTPVDDQAPEAFTNLLRVEEGGGAFVTEEHLLVRDQDSREEALRVEFQRTARHGRLELQGRMLQQGDRFSLQDLRGLRLRYIHDDSETTEDEVDLKVTDGLNSAAVVLLIQVLPMNDEPPQLGGGLRGELKCQEGGRVQVTVDYLSATDRDSEDSRLTYMLARSPGRGELQRAGLTVDKFSQQDLLQGHVYYVHTGGEIGTEPVFDTVTLIISDGEAAGMDGCCHGDALPPPVPLHGTLPVYDLNITVLPVNNQVPAVTVGASTLVVDEGSSACLCGGLLGATDLDSPPDQLTFHLDTPPLHGFLENTLPMPGSEKSNAGVRVESFSLIHLTAGFINYIQSESEGVEPTVDQLSVSVSDGLHRSTPTPLYIIISPTNDEMPSLLLTNFTVKEGGMRELTPSILNGFDLDTPPDVLTFTVVQPPAHGSLINVNRSTSLTDLPPSFPRTAPPSAGMKIVYMHDDTETLKDAVTLRLTDGVHTVQGTAQVTVLLVNDEEPRLLKNAGLEVDSGERRVISSVVLEAEDLDTPPQHLFYVVITQPRFGKLLLKVSPRIKAVRLAEGQRVVLTTDVLLASDSAGRPEELVYKLTVPPRHGLVHAVRRPGVPLLSFTQLDVAAHRVCYTHDNSRHAESDSFSFVVTNGDSSRGGSLHFTIEHGDRIPPTLRRNTGLRLQGGSIQTITADHLQLTDPDTANANLSFVITQLPHCGKLLLQGVLLTSPPLSFTQTDVDELNLAYQHDPGSLVEMDRFYFLPSDGSNRGYLEFGQLREEATVFNIQVRSSTNMVATRQITWGRLKTSVVDLGGGRHGIFITSKHLQASDGDSPAEELEFSIVRPPLFGYLENALTSESYIKGRFTQRDVDQRAVVFVLPADVEVTADSFRFRLTDAAGNSALPQMLELSWSRVQLSATCYRTCEMAGTLQIRIQRSGRSADPAYVAIQVEEGSAKPGRDFTHSSAALVQFDPGVSLKTWNIYLMDDGLEETHETFTVTLKNPQNAVLGQRSSASVEIIDPRGGEICSGAQSLVLKAVSDLLKVSMRCFYVLQHASISINTEISINVTAEDFCSQSTNQSQKKTSPDTGKSVTSSCPDGWTHYRRRCYILSSSVASWAGAERSCSLLFNGSLTSVGSRRDMTWLWKLAGRKPFWIGLSGAPGRWTWADGRSVSFSRLRGAPPSRSQSDVASDCVLVENPRSWISTSCSPETQHWFICSSPAHTH
uniref:C-type lectin domain-containing protein n=1 Tax=Mola mola TaxID=94237 RepID=A0A3Q3W4V2_MOLML